MTATYNLDYVPAKEDFVLGGYDAKSCEEKTRKTYDPAYAAVELDPFTSGDMGRMEAGNVRELEVIELWKAAMDPQEILVVPACDRSTESKRARAELTMKTLANPGQVKVIINARLPQLWGTHRTGEPDALLRDTEADGTTSWLPVDMKDHKSLEGTRKGLSWMVSTLAAPEYTDASETVLYPGIPQKVDGFQLAHYHRMLGTLGYASATPRGAIIGREGVLVWHDLTLELYGSPKKSALEYYDSEFERRVEIAAAAKKGIALTGPEWKTDCPGCPFRTTCHDELKLDLDHITLLPGITPKRAQAHYDRGLTTVKDLSHLHHRTATLVDAGVDVKALLEAASDESVAPGATIAELLQEQEAVVTARSGTSKAALRAAGSAALALAGVTTVADVRELDNRTAEYSGSGVWDLADSIDQARVSKMSKVYRRRGVDCVGVTRARIEEDIDIEDAPRADGKGTLVYMIGVRTAGFTAREGENVSTRTEYHCFVDYSGTEEGEAKVFAEFWEHVSFMRAKARVKHYSYRAFHYTQHEDHAFRSLATKHAGKPGVPTMDQLEEFLGSKQWVDLYPLVSTELVWPTESMTLKATAKCVRFAWRDSDPGGGNSIAWYNDAVNSPDPEVRDSNQKRLEEYNADDCHAQLAIRDWLSRLGETRQPGTRLPSVSTLDTRFERSMRKHP